jgi:hypothetical protein
LRIRRSALRAVGNSAHHNAYLPFISTRGVNETDNLAF